jgi:hypothetical protein
MVQNDWNEWVKMKNMAGTGKVILVEEPCA